MRFKKLAAVCTTAVLTAAMAVGGMSMASAEEAPPAETPTAEVVEQAPIVEPAPVQEEVAAEPVVEPAPVVEPVVEPEPIVVEEEPVSAEPMTIQALSPPVEARTMAPHSSPTYIPYIIVAWSIDSGSVDDLWGQHYYTSEKISTVDLTALDDQLTECGMAWQVDVYDNSVKTRNLIESGVLDYPNGNVGAKEDHVDGAGLNYSWKYVTTAACPPPVVNDCVDGTDTHSTQLADLWTDVDTRSAGHHEYVENGLRVWTDDNSSNAKVNEAMAVSFPLHDTGVIGLDWDGSATPPGVNLYVDITGDGLADGTLVWEAIYGQDLWVTNGSAQALKDASVHTGGNGSANHGTIDHYLTTFPDAQVVGIAYSLGSGILGDGVINSITVGCSVHTFDYVAPPTYEPTCDTVNGHEYVDGNGTFSVEGDWATDEIDVPFTGTLADIGTELNIDADPLAYVGLHIDTAEGTIVFEEEASYAGNLWSTSAWAGVDAGMGYAAFGSIEQYIHLNGDVAVTGIRLLYTSPVESSTTVESFTIGCTLYEFKGDQPVAPEPRVSETEPQVTCDSEVGDEQTIIRTTVTGEYVWQDGQWVLVETTTTEDVTYTVTAEDIEALDCPVIITETPVVTFTDECGTDNDDAVYEDTEEYTFSEEIIDGVTVVTATATEGFQFEEGVQTRWAHEFTDEECPTPVVPEEPETPTTLTRTGAPDLSGLGFVASLLLLLGAGTFGGLKLIRGRN